MDPRFATPDVAAGATEIALLSLTLKFHDGTLVLDASDREAAAALALPDAWVFDDRVGRWRARGCDYRVVFADLHLRAERGEIALSDEARAYAPLQAPLGLELLERGKNGRVPTRILPLLLGIVPLLLLLFRAVKRRA